MRFTLHDYTTWCDPCSVALGAKSATRLYQVEALFIIIIETGNKTGILGLKARGKRDTKVSLLTYTLSFARCPIQEFALLRASAEVL